MLSTRLLFRAGRSVIYLSALALLYISAQSPVHGQDKPEGGFINTRILFVFDASNSMAGKWESDIKINIARNFLIQIIDSLQQLKNVQMALRVYGHQSPVPPQDCNDTKLEVPFDVNNAHQIRQKLRFLQPRGTTPIAYSLERSADDFPPCDNCRNIIILITDGIEACDGDPCAVSLMLQKKGIVLKPFIIGIGMDPEFKKSFDCIGYYYNADREEKFQEILHVVITQVLNSTSAQVNLLDEEGKPKETNVNMTFYDLFSNTVRHNYIHTINHRGNPDTIFLDPLISYRIEVHTLPPVFIDSVSVTAGIHTIIAADAPQGYLELVTKGRIQFGNIQAVVRQAGHTETLVFQGLNERFKYITGKYDLEIPTLPVIHLKDVEVLQSHTTTVEIPSSGIVTFLTLSPGYGSLYMKENNRWIWLANLDKNQTNQSMAMQPGSYYVVFRTINSKSSLDRNIERFNVHPGASVSVSLQ